VNQGVRTHLRATNAPRRAKLVATLGPATDGLEQDLVAAGLDVARLNFSHGTPDEHARRQVAIRAAAAGLGRPVAILQDLQGPKLRVGRLAGGGPVQLVEGQTLRITTRPVLGTAELVSCTYADLPGDVRAGNEMLLDDGLLRLTVTGVEGDTVVTRVDEGGLLGEHKGINLPGVRISAPSLADKDRVDLAFGLRELDVDFVGLSFVRSPAEVHEARALVRSLGYGTPLVAKLEKPEALEQLANILDAADGVMVARGDLGVELPAEQVPIVQDLVIREANRRGIPVIIATEMLHSMITRPRPTRAEASDVAHAVWEGTDAVMLSGETAVGRHPLASLRMMDRIVRAAESADPPLCPAPAPDVHWATPVGAVTHAGRVLAEGIGAVAIATVTRSGRTAQLLSQERARLPVYAFTPDVGVCRKLALWRGIVPVHQPLGIEEMLSAESIGKHLVRMGGAQPGDRVVVVGMHDQSSENSPGVVAHLVSD
jgi:pyruvate kinase